MNKSFLFLIFISLSLSSISQENAAKHSLLIGIPLSFSQTKINEMILGVPISSHISNGIGLTFDYRYNFKLHHTIEIGYILNKYKLGFDYKIDSSKFPFPYNTFEFERIKYTTFSIPLKYSYQIFQNKNNFFFIKTGLQTTIPLIINANYVDNEFYDSQSQTNIYYLQRQYSPKITQQIHGELGIEHNQKKGSIYYALIIKYGIKEKTFGHYVFYPNSKYESKGTILSRGGYIGCMIGYIIKKNKV